QDAVLPADLGDARPVALGRYDRPGRAAHDGLGDKGSDGVRALAQDNLFELVRRLFSAVLGGAAERALEAVMGADFREVKEKRLVAIPARRVPADGERRECYAVVGELPADDLPALGTAGANVMQARQAQGCFD